MNQGPNDNGISTDRRREIGERDFEDKQLEEDMINCTSASVSTVVRGVSSSDRSPLESLALRRTSEQQSAVKDHEIDMRLINRTKCTRRCYLT